MKRKVASKEMPLKDQIITRKFVLKKINLFLDDENFVSLFFLLPLQY